MCFFAGLEVLCVLAHLAALQDQAYLDIFSAGVPPREARCCGGGEREEAEEEEDGRTPP